MSMKLMPLGNHIIVKPAQREEQTKSGIVLPGSGKDLPEEGEVIAVGPGARNEAGTVVPLDVKPGQRVVFKQYSPTEFKLDGEKFLILAEHDVLAVIEK